MSAPGSPPDPTPILVTSGGPKVSWGLGAIGCLAAMSCIAAAIIAPILNSAGSSRETELCLANLRRLSRAAILYAEENERLLPGQDWHIALSKYEPDEISFACPHQRRIDPRSSGYALNKSLAGTNLDAIQDQDKTILFFDSRPVVPGTITDTVDVPRPGRHRNGRMNGVAYATGRVEALPAP